ncbi:MAG: helix-turn-helix domain-containing protein [Rhodothermaceae bacterium]|nr:helix-turn-helix domain-containing protein [Rhodothermaceae bacterium]
MYLSQLLWVIVFSVGCIQGVFLCIILFSLPSSNKTALRLLALVVAGAALMIGEELIEVSRSSEQIPHVIGSTMLIPLLLGPWVFLYCQCLALDRQRLRKQDYLHFLPFFFFAIDLLHYYLLPGNEKLAVINVGLFTKDTKMLVLLVFKAIHLFIYLFLSLQIIRSYKQSTPAQNTNTPRHQQVIWTGRILFLMTVCLAIMYGILCMSILGYEPHVDSDHVGSLILTSLIYLLAFTAIKHPVLLSGIEQFRDIHREISQASTSSISYQSSSLDMKLKKDYLGLLLNYMEEDKPYRNSNIRLDDIAQALAIPSHHLSQVINEQLGVNFNEFVNAYRVEEVKQKLLNPSHAHLNILALAFDAGFNSKTSFNRIFKQFTGKTPSLYKSHGHSQKNEPKRALWYFEHSGTKL